MTLKSIIDKYKSHATTVVWLTALIVTAGVLLGYERHVLWRIQEQNLFLDTILFFQQQMVVPGGLLAYVGSFLTQLFYYPVLGVMVLCALWWLLMWLMRRTFRVGEPWSILLLVPVALLLAANVDMGYWIYPIKLKGWYYAPTVGMIVIAALLWSFRTVSGNRIWRRVLLVVTTVAGYPLFGTYALAATVLMGLLIWRLDNDRWQAVADAVLAVVAVVAVPLLCYQYVYYQTNMVNLWWTGLPIFKILEEYPVFYTPYALLGICLVILTIGCRKHENVIAKKSKGLWRSIVVAGVLAATVAGVWYAWMKDENFHCEAAMHHYAEQTRWEDVLEEAAKHDCKPTRAVVLMRNLALSRLGRQSTEMYRYRNGSKRPASPFPLQTSMTVGNLIYYHYGMINDCHHMCVEGGVEYGWRPEHLKYMARCALMNKEVNAMYKYTGLLKHTLFHEEWAEHIEKLQQQPKMMRKDSETGPIMHMMHYPDLVGTDRGYAEKYMLNHLAEMDSNDPYLQEQCLLATLWTKNSAQFWPRFANYLNQHPRKPIPRYYKEAAYLHSETGTAPFEVPIDDSIKKCYKEFMDLLPRFDGKDLDEVRSALYPIYGDTYFFEFFLMDDLIYL